MSTSVKGDSAPVSASAGAAELQTAPADDLATAEVESVKCYCCSLTEECTPAYIGRVSARYGGRWICGLCAEAVKDEICRSSPRLIGTEEALDKHMSFCTSFRTSPPPMATDTCGDLIAAVRQLLRRSLDSPRGIRSSPNSPREKLTGEVGGAGRGPLARSSSLFSTLAG